MQYIYFECIIPSRKKIRKNTHVLDLTEPPDSGGDCGRVLLEIHDSTVSQFKTGATFGVQCSASEFCEEWGHHTDVDMCKLNIGNTYYSLLAQ